MRILTISLVVAAIVILAITGAAIATPKYNVPGQYHLALTVESPHNYEVHVEAFETLRFPVQPDGSVTIDVPRLPRRCSWQWFGITVREGSPRKLKLIKVVSDGRVVRKLSLEQLEQLPLGESGAHKL